jgi:hypothetical protein
MSKTVLHNNRRNVYHVRLLTEGLQVRALPEESKDTTPIHPDVVFFYVRRSRPQVFGKDARFGTILGCADLRLCVIMGRSHTKMEVGKGCLSLLLTRPPQCRFCGIESFSGWMP